MRRCSLSSAMISGPRRSSVRISNRSTASLSGLAIPVVEAAFAAVDHVEARLVVAAALGQVLPGVRILADLRLLHGADREVLERLVRRVEDLVRILGPRRDE